MSEPIPESVPTSADPRSHRPLKRRALTPTTAQAASLTVLFSKPDTEIPIPSSTAVIKSRIGAPPEIVANVQGSSAGAGSGEFHVYKASRRREYERVKAMDEEVEREEADKKFEEGRDEKRRRDEEKTAKNRKRRQRKKGKKGGDSEGEGEEMKGVRRGPMMRARQIGEVGLGEEEDTGEGGEMALEVVEEKGVVIHDDD